MHHPGITPTAWGSRVRGRAFSGIDASVLSRLLAAVPLGGCRSGVRARVWRSVLLLWVFSAGAERLVVVSRLGVVADALQGDHVQRPVELTVAAAVASVALLFAAGRVEWVGAGERRERRFACHPSRVTAGHEQLRCADRADTVFGQQLGSDLGYEPGELGVDLVKLRGEELDAPRDPARRVGGAVWSAAQSCDRRQQVRPGRGAETATQIMRRRHDHRVQLVERGRPRPDSAPPLEQQHPQLLALATAAGHAQAPAGDDPPRRQRGVDQIILATTRSPRLGRSHSNTVSP